jgi:HPt (histidine-containing phosphotransfer) domain-containing protein
MPTARAERTEIDDAEDIVRWAAVRANRAGSEPLDRAHLARYTLGDTSLEQEVLSLFLGQMPTYLADLSSARDEQAFKAAAHTIKGSARAIGATGLASAAEIAELNGAGGADRRRETAAAVATAFAEVARHIEAIAAHDEA